MWERPTSVLFPSVWKRFKGRKEINGSIPKFWIQDIPVEEFDNVVDCMINQFCGDEPLTKYSDLRNDAQSVKEIRQMWYGALNDKLGIICYMENPNENGKPIFAGINCTHKKENNHDDSKYSGEATCKVLDTMNFLMKQKNAFEELGTDVLLGGLGLYVPPEFRGQNIGLELLHAREDLCKAVGIKASVTVFTAVFSQILAERAGYKVLYEISYEDIEKINSRLVFPGRKEINRSIPTFWIQDIPVKEFDNVVDCMINRFCSDEPLTIYSHLRNDPQSVKQMRQMWYRALNDKLGLVCYMENPNDNGKPIFAGVNCMYTKENTHDEPKYSGEAACKVLDTLDFAMKQKNAFEVLDTDVLIGGFGIYVLPEFRGQNIGLELLKTRKDLGKAVGIKASVTVFTAAYSQILAEQAGFKVLYEISYEDIEKINSRLAFPGIQNHTKMIKYCYKIFS
ncbi:hypothetical protein RN001_008407 [Aquatica leii]|uniref:N-acetyltransferase domain-containing protein n=1 Tax=Aquatica leii TaxID=1421715 RepID=A0AAN7S9M9_9COLE|nr:hypothetical protein RN001_008407 [Aquatica leii]